MKKVFLSFLLFAFAVPLWAQSSWHLGIQTGIGEKSNHLDENPTIIQRKLSGVAALSASLDLQLSYQFSPKWALTSGGRYFTHAYAYSYQTDTYLQNDNLLKAIRKTGNLQIPLIFSHEWHTKRFLKLNYLTFGGIALDIYSDKQLGAYDYQTDDNERLHLLVLKPNEKAIINPALELGVGVRNHLSERASISFKAFYHLAINKVMTGKAYYFEALENSNWEELIESPEETQAKEVYDLFANGSYYQFSFSYQHRLNFNTKD